MRSLKCGLCAVLMAALVGTTFAADKVPLDKVPKAVLDAVKAKFPGAELKDATSEKDGDKLIYEIAIKHKDHSYDVSVSSDGKIVVIEKTITLKDLPKPVTAALEAKYAKAEIKKVEEITKDDKITYEVLLVTADKKTLEVVFDPTGKVVEETKKDK
jgi:uncharacterized membrane protein YkoI